MQEFQAGLLWSPEAFAGGGGAATLGLSQIALPFGKYIYIFTYTWQLVSSEKGELAED